MSKPKIFRGKTSSQKPDSLAALHLIEKNIAAMDNKKELLVYMPQIKGELIVLPGVFNPALTNVSPFFASNLDVRWKGERFLEIGSGSGFVSILLAKKDAIVTAVDFDDLAEKCTKRNIIKFGLTKRISFVKSDLFSSLKDARFDTIVFNPPLVPAINNKLISKQKSGGINIPRLNEGNVIERLVRSIFDAELELLPKFFREAGKHLTDKGRILIIYTNLAEKTGLISGSVISKLCKENNFREKAIVSKTTHGETYTVYKITPIR